MKLLLAIPAISSDKQRLFYKLQNSVVVTMSIFLDFLCTFEVYSSSLVAAISFTTVCTLFPTIDRFLSEAVVLVYIGQLGSAVL